jgi:hypothetical protein
LVFVEILKTYPYTEIFGSKKKEDISRQMRRQGNCTTGLLLLRNITTVFTVTAFVPCCAVTHPYIDVFLRLHISNASRWGTV